MCRRRRNCTQQGYNLHDPEKPHSGWASGSLYTVLLDMTPALAVALRLPQAPGQDPLLAPAREVSMELRRAYPHMPLTHSQPPNATSCRWITRSSSSTFLSRNTLWIFRSLPKRWTSSHGYAPQPSGGGEGTKVLGWAGLQEEGMSLRTCPKTHGQKNWGQFPQTQHHNPSRNQRQFTAHRTTTNRAEQRRMRN